MNHATFSRKGGKVRSPAKTAANRVKAAAFWNAVRTGDKPAPRRSRTPPAPEAVANLLADYCRLAGITRLEAFGSTARGEAKRGSDVDLLATFASNPGLRFFTMEDEMAAILGVPVHLLTRDSVEQMAFHTFDSDVPPLKIRCSPTSGSANSRRSVQHTQKSFSRITALMPDCWAAA